MYKRQGETGHPAPAAYGRYNNVILTDTELSGLKTEPVSYTHLGADKVRRTVMGAFLLFAADITVLLALIRLVSLLIHDTNAVRTEQYAGEQAHFIIAVGRCV